MLCAAASVTSPLNAISAAYGSALHLQDDNSMLEFDSEIDVLFPAATDTQDNGNHDNSDAHVYSNMTYDYAIQFNCQLIKGGLNWQQYVTVLNLWNQNIRIQSLPSVSTNVVSSAASTLIPVLFPHYNTIVYHIADVPTAVSFHVNIHIKQLQLLLLRSDTPAVQSATATKQPFSPSTNTSTSMDIISQQQKYSLGTEDYSHSSLPAFLSIAVDSGARVDDSDLGLAQLLMSGLHYEMTRERDGNMNSSVRMKSITILDMRKETKHSPFKHMLAPQFEHYHNKSNKTQQQQRTHTAASYNNPPDAAQALSGSYGGADGTAVLPEVDELICMWRDFSTGERELNIDIHHPCG